MDEVLTTQLSNTLDTLTRNTGSFLTSLSNPVVKNILIPNTTSSVLCKILHLKPEFL